MEGEAVKRLTADFETIWTKAFSMDRMTQEEYLRDERFGVHMVGLAEGDAPPVIHHGEDVAEVLDRIDWDDVVLVGHNLNFDATILYETYGHSPRWLWDTKAMSKLCYPRELMDHSLANMSAFLGLGEKGTDLKLSQGFLRPGRLPALVKRRMAAYCEQDVRLTQMLYTHLRERMDWMARAARVDAAEFRRIEGFTADDCIRMTSEAALELNLDIVRPIAEAEDAAARPELRKPEVFAKALRDAGVEPQMKKGKNKLIYAFAKTDPFMAQIRNHKDERIVALAEGRLAAQGNDESRRATRMLGIGQRGKLPVSLNANGAHTGRDSGGGKINLQNLRRGSSLRRAICAPKGWKLVVADLAQIEVRVMAGLTEEQWLLDAFAAGQDIYRVFAGQALLNGAPPEEVSGFHRQLAKSAFLGLGYGMGQEGFIAYCQANGFTAVDEARAAEVIHAYKNQNRQFVRFWGFCANLPQRIASAPDGKSIPCLEMAEGRIRLSRNRIHLPSGRVLSYPNTRNKQKKAGRRPEWVWGGEGDKAAGGLRLQIITENIIQAAARDVLWGQMAWIKGRLPEGGRIVHRIHDEAVYLIREEDVDEARQVIEEGMTRAPEWLPGTPLATEVGVADNWLDAKD